MSSRNEIVDSRVYTSGGLQQAFFGQYRSHVTNGGDAVPGTGEKGEHAYTATHFSKTDGYFKWAHPTQPSNWGWSNFSTLNTSYIWTANDDLALIGKLRERFDQAKGFNGGNFLGELPQTVGLLGGKVATLGKVIGGLAAAAGVSRGKKGKKRKPITRDSPIADSWLEFSFGVLPLIDDIYSLAEIAAKQNVIRQTVRASRQGVPGTYYSPWTYASCTGYVSFSKQIIVRLEQAELPTFWEQFGLADPATVPWELMPWSFAIDWVLPIGKFIEAQSFARRLKAKSIIVTEREKHHYQMSITGNFGIYILTEMLPHAGSSTSIRRTVPATLNVPYPALKSNLLGGKPLWRLANALALLGQVLK